MQYVVALKGLHELTIEGSLSFQELPPRVGQMTSAQPASCRSWLAQSAAFGFRCTRMATGAHDSILYLYRGAAGELRPGRRCTSFQLHGLPELKTIPLTPSDHWGAHQTPGVHHSIWRAQGHAKVH